MKTWFEFTQSFGDAACQGKLMVPSNDFPCRPEKFKVAGKL